MIRSPNLQVAGVTLALLFAGCHAKRSIETRQQSPLTPVAQEVQRRGYHAKESLIIEPTSWEISTFRVRSKRSFSFRADQPQPGTRDYFCRFLLFEETYDSAADARYRLAHLHLRSPDDDAQVNEYVRIMRSGFRVGNEVYFLQTDAIIFWDEVQRFAKELFSATPGAEVACAISKPNKRLERPRLERASLVSCVGRAAQAQSTARQRSEYTEKNAWHRRHLIPFTPPC